ncbi:uncharacterized protein LOC142324204 isoform X2 [Lycorma delicatula]|uniref:uncharacterized protein LOC142324204 isoform X2 n=1 Tax=Lycorma delicatula TaxID=130591 RepID=UPI003F516C30
MNKTRIFCALLCALLLLTIISVDSKKSSRHKHNSVRKSSNHNDNNKSKEQMSLKFRGDSSEETHKGTSHNNRGKLNDNFLKSERYGSSNNRHSGSEEFNGVSEGKSGIKEENRRGYRKPPPGYINTGNNNAGGNDYGNLPQSYYGNSDRGINTQDSYSTGHTTGTKTHTNIGFQGGNPVGLMRNQNSYLGYNNYGGYNPYGFTGSYNNNRFVGGHIPYGFGSYSVGGGYIPSTYNSYLYGGINGYRQPHGGIEVPQTNREFLTGVAVDGTSLGTIIGDKIESISSSITENEKDAFKEWLKKQIKKRIKETSSTNDTPTVSPILTVTGVQTLSTTTVNRMEIIQQILNETQMCPGGTAVLDASYLNTFVPCNVTDIDINMVNVTEPVKDNCKSLNLEMIQVNNEKNEIQILNLHIIQYNITSDNEFLTLEYRLNVTSCNISLVNPNVAESKVCRTKIFVGDPYHTLNYTFPYLHEVQLSISQYNTTLNSTDTNNSRTKTEERELKTRYVSTTIVNLSILPKYPINIVISRCRIFRNYYCDPESNIPCNVPPTTSLQSIRTNTTLSNSDFGNINFIMHRSLDVFQTYNRSPTDPSPSSATSTNI